MTLQGLLQQFAISGPGRGALLLAACGWVAGVQAVDDDLLAHQLYLEGRYAEAAELFTDPAWKGAALYRSQQWWRAAEAFVRAEDAQSAHNLGNAYARLGYPELALDAFRRAMSIDPTLDDARHNAEVMVKVLALKDDGQSSGRPAAENEIERIERERERESEDQGAPEGEDGDEETEASPTGDQGGAGEQQPGEEDQAGGSESATDATDSGEDSEPQARAGDGGGAQSGAPTDEPASNRASGESENSRARENAEAAGLRRELEAAQATEQWLARIAHDPRRFLERRIALELRRRQAAGNTAPEGGSVW